MKWNFKTRFDYVFWTWPWPTWHLLLAFPPSIPINKPTPVPIASPLPHTTPTSGPPLTLCVLGRIQLSFQVDVHTTSQSFISLAKVVSRTGRLCGAGRRCPQREPLPGAEVTREARNTDAFSWWQYCPVIANYCASPKYFYFEPFYPWGMKWGLENLLHIGFQDLWVWTKENSHSDPYAKKKKADILSFGGNIKEYSKKCLNKALCIFLWHTWIFITFRR